MFSEYLYAKCCKNHKRLKQKQRDKFSSKQKNKVGWNTAT